MIKKISKAVVVAAMLAPALAVSANGPGGDVAERSSVAGVTVTGTETISSDVTCANSLVEINVTGDVTGENDLGGGSDAIYLALFDDGVEEDFEIVQVPVGTTQAFDVTLSYLGTVGASAPGVGVYISDGDSNSGSTLFSEDPFFPDQQTVSSCPTEGGSVPIPTNSPAGLLILVLTLVLASGVYLVRRA